MKQIVQYYVINSDLKMSAGKAAAQAAHAAAISVLTYMEEPLFKEWLMSGQTKIMLSGRESELRKLEEKGYVTIKDAGRTEVAPGSLTAAALPPMDKEEAKMIVGHLRLYK
jgi:peptidyl-tRNA hydrolase, PTH2 family